MDKQLQVISKINKSKKQKLICATAGIIVGGVLLIPSGISIAQHKDIKSKEELISNLVAQTETLNNDIENKIKNIEQLNEEIEELDYNIDNLNDLNNALQTEKINLEEKNKEISEQVIYHKQRTEYLEKRNEELKEEVKKKTRK